MKVLKKAHERHDLAKEFTCGGCGALLRATPGDVKESSGYVMAEFEVSYYCVCPECKSHCPVKPWWNSKTGDFS